MNIPTTPPRAPVLVVGATGKAGRRVAERLTVAPAAPGAADRAGRFGRVPRTFGDYAVKAAATGVWRVAA